MIPLDTQPPLIGGVYVTGKANAVDPESNHHDCEQEQVDYELEGSIDEFGLVTVIHWGVVFAEKIYQAEI